MAAGRAVVVDGRTLNHDEFDERARRWAAWLMERGVGEGDRVAVMLPNCAEFFEVARATALLEALFLPVNIHLKHEELSWILEDSTARVLVDEPDVDLPPPVDDLAGGWPSPALVFYTSGTTGRPKGVVHGEPSVERLGFVQDMLMQLWGVTGDDTYLLAGPAYHAGPGGYALTALYAGGAVVILPRWDAREFLRLVADERATFTFLTPAHFIRILEVPEAERAAFDVSSLRLVIHGGAPCPVPVKERIMAALPHTEIHELYGASEGGATRITPAEWRERPGSVGTPWPGVEIRILDDEGAPVPTGEDGLVFIRPAGGARFRYHRDDDKTAGAWRDDAFTVGDIGHLDADGYLYLTDRASDMVIRGGVNIYPREIEEVLHRHPAVVDCAVFGVPDERDGEALRAMVEVRHVVDPEDLRTHVREHLAAFKVPAIIELVAELPRDPNGKILKRRLRDAAATPPA